MNSFLFFVLMGILAPASAAGEMRISGDEFVTSILILAAGSVLLIMLIWFWSLWRRRRLSLEIERNEALFNAFFQASPAGMAIFDRDLCFVRVNAPMAALHGAPVELLQGQALEQILPDLAQRVAPLMHEVLVAGSSIENIEVSLPMAGSAGQTRRETHLLVSLFPLSAPQGRNPIGVGAVVQDISPSKEVQQALERSRAELRRLSAHREGMIEREHQRLAREFHDELGQLLTTARMHLQLLARQIEADPAQVKESVRNIDAMIVEAYRSIKTIASDLRPAALNLGLTAAIEWLVERMFTPLGIACTVDFDSQVDRLDDDPAIALFRIVQESLTNIVRHAEARRVQISIKLTGATLRLRIEDDGKGFDTHQVDRAKKFGLLGIAERVAALDGKLELDSGPGAGTRVAVVLSDVPFKTA